MKPSTGTHLGNTPQAFSHIGLINSVLYLESVLKEKSPEPVLTYGSTGTFFVVFAAVTAVTIVLGGLLLTRFADG